MKDTTPKLKKAAPVDTEEAKANAGKIAEQVRVDSAALLEKYKDQNLEIKRGDNGKLKVIATFQKGSTGYRFIKQVRPADLGTVAADLDAAMTAKPGPRKMQKGTGGTRSAKAQAILDNLKNQNKPS